MPDHGSFADWSRERQQRIERVLDGLMPADAARVPKLVSAMRYATLGRGQAENRA